MKIDLSSVILPALSGLSEFFTSLAQQERSKEGAEYSDNPLEQEQTEEEISQTRVVISYEGSEITLRIETSGSLWDGIMENGNQAPAPGGNNGTVTEPDGSTRSTNVPEQLWGSTTISEYAEPPSVWRENFLKMAKTLLPDLVKDSITERKSEIAKLIKPLLIEQLGASGV